MSTQESGPLHNAGPNTSTETEQPGGARVGTVVWGLVVVALAALIIISKLGVVVLDGTYVLIGLMIGAGAALIIGGLVSARSRGSKAKETE
jgi:hypothetical protein